MMVKSTSAIVAASLMATAMAKSSLPVCEVVTITETGSPVWIPVSTGWDDLESVTATTTITASAESATSVYTETWDDWTSTVPEALTATTYTIIPVVPTTTTTSESVAVLPTHTGGWGNSTVSSSSVSSVAAISTSEVATTTSAAPSTTTSVAPAAATCPTDNGQAVLPGGSCGCEFTVNCGVQASPDANTKFWEQTSGALVPTLEECLELCDNNSNCQAALWVDDSSSGDYHHCWQVSGLGQPVGTGIAQISYKGTCDGTCSSNYGSSS